VTGRGAWAVAAGLALLGLLAGCTADAAQPKRQGAAHGTASPAAYVLPECPRLPAAKPVDGGLPDLTLPCLGGGRSVDLAALRGTPMVLNVWAAWCANCDREMPLFAAAMAQAGDRVRFFGIHYKAAERYGEQSAADFGVPFPSVHDEDGDQVARALRATAPPQTLFVTADGRIAGREVGEIRSQQELDRLVERYLGVAL
jgi:cytochrome c biogenesis protein CcmG, thiol:disulfide interchange protein DsbE